MSFVSYGGRSMFAGLLAVGLLQNIHLRSTATRSARAARTDTSVRLLSAR